MQALCSIITLEQRWIDQAQLYDKKVDDYT